MTGEVKWKGGPKGLRGKKEKVDCRYLEVKTKEKAIAIGN